jgi:hypothetical protein
MGQETIRRAKAESCETCPAASRPRPNAFLQQVAQKLLCEVPRILAATATRRMKT